MADNNEPAQFDGTPLRDVAGVSEAERRLLQQYGFVDAEQVAAALIVPNVKEQLATAWQVPMAEIDKLQQNIRAVVPAIASTADVTPLSLGALAPTPEVLQQIQLGVGPQIAAPAALPPFINHAQHLGQPKNQGARGTCVSFAMTAVHEYHSRRSGRPTDYSEQFLYHETKKIDGSPATCGTWQVRAAQVLNNLGQCVEAVWPYNGSPPCNNNGVQPPNSFADAGRNRLATIILMPTNVGAIKAALAGGSVVGFSVPVYNSWFQSSNVAMTGRITMPIGGEQYSGGHAMCLIGYHDDAGSPGGGYFILRNSWYGSWGTHCPYGSGNGTIPYAYIGMLNWEAVTTAPPVSVVA